MQAARNLKLRVITVDKNVAYHKAFDVLNPSQAEVAIASEGIAQEKTTGKATLATLDKEREALIQQRIQIGKQLERDTRELQQVEIDLSQTIISAPASGTLFKLNLGNSSQTVQSGEEIAQIAPSKSTLVIKTLVAAEDVSKVNIGQKAQLRVSAYSYRDYGTLKGKVNEISSDAIASQGYGVTAISTTTTPSQNVAAVAGFYEVAILPESLALGQGKNQCLIQLGMEDRVNIISREETVLQFLLRKVRLIADL